VAEAVGASPPRAPRPSRWHEAPEARRAAIEAQDGFAPLRNKLREIAGERDEWAGIPIPIEGESLVVEPGYPFAAALSGKKELQSGEWKVRNTFRSTHRRCDIHIVENAGGKIEWAFTAGVHHLDLDLRTLGCSDAHGIEQESAAVHLLAELTTHRQFKHYMLTGTFLESSERSLVTYMFRRLRPTVAMSGRSGEMRILCTLCLHPIAYYAGTWAGAMAPTDDVVAHLMLMRGDEPMFWRRSSQHPPHRPEAGL